MGDEDQVSLYWANLEDEQDSAYLYRVLADVEPDERLSGVYRRLAETEEKLLKFWEHKIQDAGSEELGIDPEELGGSARGAAVSSYLLFAVGAIVPVFPFFFLSGLPAIVASALASVAGLFALGAATTLFTGRSVLLAGSRQVLVGAVAAALTYVLGAVLGTSVGG